MILDGIAKLTALSVGIFGVLAVIGLLQGLLSADGMPSWFAISLTMIAVACGALAFAVWNMRRS